MRPQKRKTSFQTVPMSNEQLPNFSPSQKTKKNLLFPLLSKQQSNVSITAVSLWLELKLANWAEVPMKALCQVSFGIYALVSFLLFSCHRPHCPV
jgi:hypothetical protein